MGPFLVVPEALEKGLQPRRSLVGSASPPTTASVGRLLARIASAYSSGGPSLSGTTHARVFEAGLRTKKEPALAPLRRAAHTLLCAPGMDAVREADLEVLAAAQQMLGRAALSLLPAVAVLRSLPDALRVALRSTYYGLGSDGDWTKAVFVVSAETCGRCRGVESWLPLRHAVCGAPEREYAEGRETARILRQGLDLERRAHLAYAFPDEPWANEDLLHPEAAALDPRSGHIDGLLSAAHSLEAVSAHAARRGLGILADHALDLVHALAPADVVPLLAEALPGFLEKPGHGPLLKTPPRRVAEALACLRLESAAAALAPYASHPVLAPIVLGYFRDAPEFAAVLRGAAPARGKAAEAIDRVLGAKEEPPAALAPPPQIPPVLREAPWRPQKGRRVRPEVKEGLEVLGLELERVALPRAPIDFASSVDKTIRDMTAAELARWWTAVKKGEYFHVDYEYERASRRPQDGEWARVPEQDGLRAWNEANERALVRGDELHWVARHGLLTIPGFMRRSWMKRLEFPEGGQYILEIVGSLVSPRIAPSMARVAARRKRFRRIALAWLGEHAEVAALGLIPDAVGAPGEARSDAEDALLWLAGSGRSETIRAAARRYGPEAERIAAALLARDPLAMGATVPKPPAFLRVARLPAVLLASGKALGEEARTALVEMLQVTPLDPPYPGLALVREACDARSLGRLALGLTEQWVLADAPGRHEWMLFATIHFPSEEGTRRVGALARAWSRKNAARAARACAALARLRSDLALMHLSHVAETTPFDAVRREAESLLLEAAQARGLSRDELGDRTVPDPDLDADGTLTLSYGARAFLVSLDHALSPVVRERLGKGLGGPLTTLPRPGKADDATAAREARARFDALKADLAHSVDRQIRRLERAMTCGRSWTSAEFRQRIVQQPLLLPLARRLVWEALARDGTSTAFRLAEDGTFADAGDSLLKLDPEARVRLAHPARSTLTAWGTVLASYEIIQPFAQVGRAVFTLTARERSARQLDRAAGIVVPGRKLHGILESRSWRREDAGQVNAYRCAVRTGQGAEVTARLPISPGLSLEDLAEAPDQTTGAIVLEGEGPGPLGSLDPVGFSELVRDVEALRGLG
jgi:hypothetical protein